MTKTLRALGVAASLLMGTALAASAAVTANSQGATAPPAPTTGTQYSNSGTASGDTSAPQTNGIVGQQDNSPGGGNGSSGGAASGGGAAGGAGAGAGSGAGGGSR